MVKQVRRTVCASAFFFVICGVLVSSARAQTPVIPPDASNRVTATSDRQTVAKASTAIVAPLPAETALRIGIGDMLEVSVYGVPELTQKARVSSSGDIYLPLVNYVHVAKLTPDQAQAIIEKKLVDGGFLRNAHVTVQVTEYVSESVTVLGEVVRPGTYPVLGDRNLLDIISAAGGPTDKAGKAVTIVHREHPDQAEVVDLAKTLGEGGPVNPTIAVGDTIIVSKAGVVYVVGEVAKPSGFLMENGSLTVLKAIALAGGTTHSAALNNAKIIRKTPGGMEETPIPLKKILAAKAPDIPMQPEDVLFVPGSASKNVAVRGLEAVLQTATALSIVAVH
ncbi:MAG TPA: polysaccharide biosynthesis/export family protein [Terriglobales bacterium]|nr:polysaccharide biosynthesis/export family protein [Terriglobales bacterium]